MRDLYAEPISARADVDRRASIGQGTLAEIAGVGAQPW